MTFHLHYQKESYILYISNVLKFSFILKIYFPLLSMIFKTLCILYFDMGI